MNEEHLAVLKKDVATWNAWRSATLRDQVSQLDLRGACLEHANLTDANLWLANLEGANLRGANLTRASLIGTSLTNADLVGANLTNATAGAAAMRNADLSSANLFGADLETAILTDANLDSANLTNVNLTRATLQGTNLRKSTLSGARMIQTFLYRTNLSEVALSQTDFNGARCWQALFAAVDLSVAIGLESIVHLGPSTVGADTLSLSRGRIPSKFLQGCGFSDWEIEAARLYDPTLSGDQLTDIKDRLFQLRVGGPNQIKLFISYTHADSSFVGKIAHKLNENGIRYWRDVHDATAGRLDKVIDRAMRLNPTVLLILSKHSVDSDWVEDEAARARALEKDLSRDVLCPIALDDAWKNCRWSRPLRTQIEKYNILPFHGWEDETTMSEMFERLVRGLSIFYRSATSSDDDVVMTDPG